MAEVSSPMRCALLKAQRIKQYIYIYIYMYMYVYIYIYGIGFQGLGSRAVNCFKCLRVQKFRAFKSTMHGPESRLKPAY